MSMTEGYMIRVDTSDAAQPRRPRTPRPTQGPRFIGPNPRSGFQLNVTWTEALQLAALYGPRASNESRFGQWMVIHLGADGGWHLSGHKYSLTQDEAERIAEQDRAELARHLYDDPRFLVWRDVDGLAVV